MIKKLKKMVVKIQLRLQNLNCKIYHGPYIYNFEEIYKIFEKNNISKKIKILTTKLRIYFRFKRS